MRKILAISALVLLTACSSVELSPYQKWQQLEAENYDVSFQQSCYCPQVYRSPMRLKIRSGKIISGQYLTQHLMSVPEAKEQPLIGQVSDEVLADLETLDQWFDFIEQAKLQNYYRLEIRYDHEQFYPTEIITDFRQEIADEERHLVFKDLQLISEK